MQECEEFWGNAHTSFHSEAGQVCDALVEKCSVTFVGVSYHLSFLSCVSVGESGIPVYKAVASCLAFMRNGLSLF